MLDVKGFEDFYCVTEFGIVYSKRFRKPLKAFADKNGYLYVDLFDGINKKQRFSVHRLVATTFLGEPEDGMDVNHKDYNRQNNHISNLEWVTRRENILYSHGHKVKAVVRMDKITLEPLETYENMGDAVLQGYKKPEIIKCCKGRLKSHYGFKWKYLD